MLIKDMLFAYYQTQCLYIVSELRIADYLEHAPCSVSKLASRINVDENKLYRIMRFISSLGLFDEVSDKTFQLNEESKYLLTSSKNNIGNFIKLHGEYFYTSATKMLDSLELGTTPFELQFGEISAKYFTSNAKAKIVYNEAMKENSELVAREIIHIYDFSKYKNIIDIGGGIGSLLANILLEHKLAHGINFDLPELKELSTHYLQGKQILEGCKFIGGDMFKNIPSNGDLYLMKAILHGKSDEIVIKLLSLVKQVLNPNRPLLLIERVIISANSQDNLNCYINDINMLNVTQGYVRNFDEYKTILEQVGFVIVRIYPISDSLSIFECKVKD